MEETICTNRKARHDYHIIETMEAGIVLEGTEIKSIREHRVSLESSYARVRDGEVWLVGCSVERFTGCPVEFNHDPERDKKLLLHKDEIRKFAEKSLETGHTLIPLKLYLKDGRAKIELAIAKGKQLHDKRQSIKEKDAEREIRRKS